MRTWVKWIVVCAVVPALCLGVFITAGTSGENAKALFETKCSKCHGFDRPLSKSKSIDGWKKTVASMQKKKGDWINDAEAAQIAEYLAEVAGK